MYNNSAALQESLSLTLISSEVNLMMTFYYTDELISRCKCKMSLFCFFSSQIATAVRFLQNQQVRESPLATRKAFLKKKGEHHQYVLEPNVKHQIFTCRMDRWRLNSKTLTLNLTSWMLLLFISNMSGISLVKKAFFQCQIKMRVSLNIKNLLHILASF